MVVRKRFMACCEIPTCCYILLTHHPKTAPRCLPSLDVDIIFMLIVLSSLLNCHVHFAFPSIPFLFHFHSHGLSFFASILISILCSVISFHARFHVICLKALLGHTKKNMQTSSIWLNQGALQALRVLLSIGCLFKVARVIFPINGF